MNPLQLPPHSMEAEQHILGCCLLDEGPSIALCLEHKLPLAAFYSPANRAIYEKICEIYKKKTAVDIAVLAEEFKAAGQLDEIGGPSYLVQLGQSVPTTAKIRYFVDKLKDHHMRREIIAFAQATAEKAAQSEGGNGTELVAEIKAYVVYLSKTAEGGLTGTVKPYTVWEPSAFLSHEIAPGQNLLGEGFLRKGEFTTLIGQGGLGKSRLSLWMACCQITGRQWCGIPTAGDPQIWLMIGNENSIARQKDDLSKILPHFDGRERALIEEHLRIHALATFEDSFLELSEPDSKARLDATLEQVKPGVLVIDPFANLVIGDENKTPDVRDTLRTLAAIVRRVVPECAILLLHHARTGSLNIAQASGYDAPNFGRGSKVLFSACRCQLNLAPGDAEDERQLVLSCGKSNNGAKFKTRGLIFDEHTFEYRVNESFDLEAWKDDVSGKRGNQSCSIEDVVETVRDGIHRTKEIIDTVIGATGCSAPTVKRRLKEACDKGYLQPTIPRGTYTLGPNADKIKSDH